MLQKIPLMKEMVKRWIFDESGQYLRYPDKSPLESFSAAAQEVRNAITGERLRGKEEARTTRTQLERAAITEDSGARPEATPSDNKEDEVSAEDSYIDIWKKNRKQQLGET